MILLVGASGNAGSETAKQLSALGVKARALVRDTAKASSLNSLGFETVQGDLGDYGSLRKALEGIEKVFLATTTSPYMTAQYMNLLEAAKRSGVRHVVKVSVFGAADNAILRAGRWHYTADQYLRNSSIPYTIFYPNSFMQNFLGQAPAIANGAAFYAPAKQAAVSFIDVRDIASCAVTALTTPGFEYKQYTLTGADALTHAQIATLFSNALGKKVSYVDTPPEATRSSLAEMGFPGWLVDLLLELYAWFQTGEGALVSGDVESILGRPPVSFEQFIRDYSAAFAA